MTTIDRSAVVEFLEAGGRVSRMPDSIGVTEAELLHYLESCGTAARYCGGESRAYLCAGKRLSLSKLVEFANQGRRSLQLPPFAVQVVIRYSGSRPALPKK
jgi:hypothetical protein